MENFFCPIWQRFSRRAAHTGSALRKHLWNTFDIWNGFFSYSDACVHTQTRRSLSYSMKFHIRPFEWCGFWNVAGFVRLFHFNILPSRSGKIHRFYSRCNKIVLCIHWCGADCILLCWVSFCRGFSKINNN